MKILVLLCALFAVGASAAPFVKTDPVAAGVTQCGFYVDAAPVNVVPVTGNICQLDVSTISTGAHAVFVDVRTTNDPFFGTQISAKSPTSANFTRPALPPAPTNPVLSL